MVHGTQLSLQCWCLVPKWNVGSDWYAPPRFSGRFTTYFPAADRRIDGEDDGRRSGGAWGGGDYRAWREGAPWTLHIYGLKMK